MWFLSSFLINPELKFFTVVTVKWVNAKTTSSQSFFLMKRNQEPRTDIWRTGGCICTCQRQSHHCESWRRWRRETTGHEIWCNWIPKYVDRAFLLLSPGTDRLVLQRSNGLMHKAMTKNMILVVTLRHSLDSKHFKFFSFENDSCQYFYFSISKQTGVKSKLPGPPPTDTVTLDTHNFDQIALVCLLTCYISFNCSCFPPIAYQDSSKNVLVAFTVS